MQRLVERLERHDQLLAGADRGGRAGPEPAVGVGIGCRRPGPLDCLDGAADGDRAGDRRGLGAGQRTRGDDLGRGGLLDGIGVPVLGGGDLRDEGLPQRLGRYDEARLGADRLVGSGAEPAHRHVDGAGVPGARVDGDGVADLRLGVVDLGGDQVAHEEAEGGVDAGHAGAVDGDGVGVIDAAGVVVELVGEGAVDVGEADPVVAVGDQDGVAAVLAGPGAVHRLPVAGAGAVGVHGDVGVGDGVAVGVGQLAGDERALGQGGVDAVGGGAGAGDRDVGRVVEDGGVVVELRQVAARGVPAALEEADAVGAGGGGERVRAVGVGRGEADGEPAGVGLAVDLDALLAEGDDLDVGDRGAAVLGGHRAGDDAVAGEGAVLAAEGAGAGEDDVVGRRDVGALLPVLRLVDVRADLGAGVVEGDPVGPGGRVELVGAVRGGRRRGHGLPVGVALAVPLLGDLLQGGDLGTGDGGAAVLLGDGAGDARVAGEGGVDAAAPGAGHDEVVRGLHVGLVVPELGPVDGGAGALGRAGVVELEAVGALGQVEPVGAGGVGGRREAPVPGRVATGDELVGADLGEGDGGAVRLGGHLAGDQRVGGELDVDGGAAGAGDDDVGAGLDGAGVGVEGLAEMVVEDRRAHAVGAGGRPQRVGAVGGGRRPGDTLPPGVAVVGDLLVEADVGAGDGVVEQALADAALDGGVAGHGEVDVAGRRDDGRGVGTVGAAEERRGVLVVVAVRPDVVGAVRQVERVGAAGAGDRVLAPIPVAVLVAERDDGDARERRAGSREGDLAADGAGRRVRRRRRRRGEGDQPGQHQGGAEHGGEQADHRSAGVRVHRSVPRLGRRASGSVHGCSAEDSQRRGPLSGKRPILDDGSQEG